MPELPEVETTRRGVAPHIERQKVTGVSIYDHRLRWPVPADLGLRLVGKTVDRVERRSKYLLFRIADDTLVVHLGMSGSLRAFAKPPPREKHDHVDISFENGVVLRFRDPRRFGSILWVEGQGADHPLLMRLGPEPLTPGFDAAYLHRSTRRRGASIKVSLMDNRLVVGVGNIYANESLFRAGIRPTRAANRISHARLVRLVAAVRDTLSDAIAKGGSSLRDYVASDGEHGSFQLGYFVYGREGEPCRVCATPIRSLRQGGRATFYCPRCQT